MKKIYILVFTMLVLTYCQAQEVTLGLKLEEGKEYKQISTAKATIIQDVNGQKVNIIMTIKGAMSYFVTMVNENDYDMQVKYEKISMSMQLPQGTMEFSSEKNDEKDIFSLILSQMNNIPFDVKMTKRGKIAAVKNIESLWESAFKKFPQLTEAQLLQIRTQLVKAYGEEAFKGSLEMVTAIFPDRPVSKGSKWTINTKLESGISANMITTYTFAEKNKDYVLIIGESKIETADKDAYVRSNGMPMKYDLTGTMASEIKVNNDTGWIVEAKIHQEIKGDAYIKENSRMPKGMKIPIIMKNEMQIVNN